MPSSLPRVGPDIEPILSLVRKTRLLLRGSWGLTGVGFTLGLAFAAIAVVTAIDMLVPLVAPWVRLIGLVLFAVPTLVVFVWKCVLPLSRRLRNVEIARRIESRIPGIHSRLVSCMDLAGRKGEVSPAFYRKLVDESLDRIGSYRSTSVVDFHRLRKALLFATVGVGVFALLWLGLGNRLTTALARVVQPFADIPPASDVAYGVEPGTTKVLIGEDVNFAVTVTHGQLDSLSIELVGKDAIVRHPLKKDADGVWQLTVRGLHADKGFENGFTYRVFGGRTWTKENRIDWAERPVILETTVKLHFPDYMAISEPRLNPAKERDAIGPVGSRVETTVEVEGEIGSAEIELHEGHEHVIGKYRLERTSDGQWTGSFPLNGVGTYRVELRNDTGHANKSLREYPKYRAIADQPPIVIIERPGVDVVLSKPTKVPVTIAVRDDYGLLDLWIATQKQGEPKLTRTINVKEYATPNPLKADSVVAWLDLTSSGLHLKPGDTLRYRAEVRDRRPNSKPIVSKEFVVRIAEDADAADKMLEAFEEGQDTFRDKLANLIAEQKKVKEKIDRVQTKYDALTKDAVEMTALRKDLADLFEQERKNVATAAALERDLKKLAEQAQKNSLLDIAINKEIQNLAGQFKNAALDPLQGLASKLQQGADAAQSLPDLKGVKNLSDRVQKNLESCQNRMDALAEAQKGAKVDVEKALAKLNDDLLKEQGRMTARDLEELKDTLKNLRQELAKLQGKQEDLADRADKAAEAELPEVEKKQLSLDELLKKELELAKKILERERTRNMSKRERPDETLPEKIEPKKDDTPPDRNPKKSDNPLNKLPPLEKDQEDLLKPALKGEREKLDPRFDKKLQMPKKKDSADRRDALKEHQQDNLRDLDAAQKGLKSDEQTLEEMIKLLMNAAQEGGENQQSDPSGKSRMDQLMNMLRSETMKDAKQMAQRARNGREDQSQQGTPPPMGTAADSLMGNSIGAAGLLDELDPTTRATIIQLPARVREELLQGMKSQGPEGYQKFIQDYFRRLADLPK